VSHDLHGLYAAISRDIAYRPRGHRRRTLSGHYRPPALPADAASARTVRSSSRYTMSSRQTQ